MADKIIGPPLTRTLRLADFLPYRLSVLSNRISRAIAAAYSDRFDLTLPEWRVMAILGEHPDISAADVSERTAMDKVAVSRALKRLIAAGRVERHMAADDKRRSVLALSMEGQRVYEEIVPIALGYEETLLAYLDAPDIEALEKALQKLGGAVEGPGKT